MDLPIFTFIRLYTISLFLNLFPKRDSIKKKQYYPSVSVLVSVYNESDIILKKIANFQALNYPNDLLEMIIVSDGSVDETEYLISTIDDARIKLIVLPNRSGKNQALNIGVASASKDILLFTDADSMFNPDAVNKLAIHFLDRDVGLVSGRSIY